jgi:hypothetical protein
MNKGFYGISKNRTYEAPTSASYASSSTSASYASSSTSASYALTASYAMNGGGGGGSVNPTSGYIPYNNAGTFADSYILQSGGYLTIGASTLNNLGFGGWVQLWDGAYQPTYLQAAFGNFQINQNSYYDYADAGKIKYAQNGYSQRIQMEPSLGQMIFFMGRSGSAGQVTTESIAIGIQNSGNVGIGKQYPNSKLDVSGSAIISGSLTVTSDITGSLQGTASWATNFVSASNYVLNSATSSFVLNSQTSSFVQNNQTSSFATTGSNTFNGTQTITGSGQLLVKSSATSGYLQQTTDYVASSTGTNVFIGLGATTGNTYGVLSTRTTGGTGNGNLALVSAGGNVAIGKTTFNAVLDVNGNTVITGSLAIQSTLTAFTSSTTSAGVNTLFTQATSSYNSAFGKYTVLSGSNARAGEFMAVWNSGSITYTDIATTDIGSTSNVTFSSSFSGANILLQATSSAGWNIKMLATFI